MTMKIQLKSIDDVKVFVNEVNKVACDVDLASGRYVVDAKSIMGIFSLDLTSPITMEIHSKEKGECDDFLKAIERFKV